MSEFIQDASLAFLALLPEEELGFVDFVKNRVSGVEYFRRRGELLIGFL